MTQIQNTPALPGGLGAMPSVPAGRKDGGSADFSRLLNQSNQQLQQQSAQSARSISMSSGSAITTGPGRPEVAVWNARLITSGMRAGSSISHTHLAIEPNMAR